MVGTQRILPVVVAVGMLAGGCASQQTPPSGPASAAAATAQAGRFVWHDLVTKDPAASRAFYSALLGWQFEDTTINGRPYAVATLNGAHVGGIVKAPAEVSGPAVWLPYLAVADLDGAVRKVTDAGGKVLVAATPVSTMGSVAAVLDPQGAPLGLAVPRVDLPAEPSQPVVGQFFWAEYMASDVPRALSFYKDLVGFESSVGATQNGLEYHVLRRQRARAGLYQLPRDASAITPNWLPYVRVADPAALAARATALGGTVLFTPSPDVRHGTLAIVADPTGGAVALQKWAL